MTENNSPLYSAPFIVTDAQMEAEANRLGITVTELRLEIIARTYTVPRRYTFGGRDD